jgi:RNA polymerase sigma factor (sigma-70 family)
VRWFAEAKAAARGSAGERHATEDLIHETLLRTIEHPPHGERPGAWIQRIYLNLRVDGWRAQARSQRLIEQLPIPSSVVTGEEAALARERRRAVRRAVMELPRQQRRTLILRYQGGWPFDRIAARLGMTEPTARTRVHRALATLRVRMAALRVMIAPGGLALKPALAVLIVLAADPSYVPAYMSGAKPFVPVFSPASALAVAPAAPRKGFLSTRAPRSHAVGSTLFVRTEEPAGEGTVVPPHSTRAHQQTRYEEPPAVKRIYFEGDEVIGELERPDEELVETVERARHLSLIELRREFLAELAKSLEDL